MASTSSPLQNLGNAYTIVSTDEDLAPDLAHFLSKVVIREENITVGKCRKVTTRVAFTILGGLGAYFGWALFFRPAMALKGKSWQITSGIGSLAAGVFPLRSWVDIGEDWSVKHSPEEKALRRRYLSLPARIVKGALDYSWGVFTQFPVTEIVFNFNKHPGLAPIEAVCTLVGVAPPTIKSSENLSSTIESGGRRVYVRYISKDKKRATLSKIQQFLLQQVKLRLQQGLRMSSDERIARFAALYNTEFDELQGELHTVRQLLRELVITVPTDANYQVQAPTWHRRIDVSTQIAMGLITVILADGIQTSGMTRDSAHLLTDDDTVTVLLQVLVFFSWLYISAEGPGAVAAKVYRQATDFFGVPREKTFAEQYYPKMSKLGDGLAVVMSWLMLGENIEIGAPYFNTEKTTGKILLGADVVACTGYFMDAMSALAESAIESFARSRYSGAEERHAIHFKDKCDRIKGILSEVATPDLEALLQWADDPELNDYIAENALKEGELLHLSLGSGGGADNGI